MHSKGILILVFTLYSAIIFAQTNTYSGENEYGDFYGSIDGTEKYTYKTNEYGKKIMHGTYTFSGKITPQNDIYDYIGTYNLTAGMKDGLLNGNFTQNSSYIGKVFDFPRWISFNSKYKCSGVFLNGKPNGAFNCTIGEGSKFSSTLKDGKYIGSYYFEGLVKNNVYTIRGQLTTNGQLTGKWSYKDLNRNIVYDFLNDVLISTDNGDYETPPALQELAKKFANGSISEEELLAQETYVETDSLPLNLFTAVLDEDEIGLNRFNPNYSDYKQKKYKKLVQLSFFTEDGFKLLLKNPNGIDRVGDDNLYISCGGLSDVKIDKYGIYCISCGGIFPKRHTTSHQSGYVAYLTPKQTKILDSINLSKAHNLYETYESPNKEILRDYIADSTELIKQLKEKSTEELSNIKKVLGANNDIEIVTRFGKNGYSIDSSYLCISYKRGRMFIKNTFAQKDMLVAKIQEILLQKEEERRFYEQKIAEYTTIIQEKDTIIKNYTQEYLKDKIEEYERSGIAINSNITDTIELIEIIKAQDDIIKNLEEEKNFYEQRITEYTSIIQKKDVIIKNYSQEYLKDEIEAYERLRSTMNSNTSINDTLDLVKIVNVQNDVIKDLDLAIEIINRTIEQKNNTITSFPELHEIYNVKSSNYNYNCANFSSPKDFSKYYATLSSFATEQNIFDSIINQYSIIIQGANKITEFGDEEITNAYKSCAKKFPISEDFKTSLNNLTILQEKQTKYIHFGELKNKYKLNKDKITNECVKPFEDIAESFITFEKDYNLSAYGDIDKQIKALNKFIVYQDSCLEFINTRKEIENNNNNILSQAKSYPNIIKIYSAYFESQDLSWAFSTEKLINVIDVQKSIQKILSNDNAKEYERQVKKSKEKDINFVLNLTIN